MSLLRDTTHSRIYHKALMPHCEDFLPPNEQKSWIFSFQVRAKCASSVHNIRSGHLLSSSYLMRGKNLEDGKLLAVSRLQLLDIQKFLDVS